MRAFAYLLATAAVATLAVCVSPATPAGRTTMSCPRGATNTVIGGKAACLRAGASCQSRFAAQYRKHGYTCVSGRLRKSPAKPEQRPTTYPTIPPPPSGPDTRTLPMPPASALPEAASSIALPAGSRWDPGVGDLTVTANALWVSSGIFRIDPTANGATGPFSDQQSEDIGAGEGSIWASGYTEDVVRRFDAATGKQVAVVQLPAGSSPEGIADASGSIWVAAHHGGTLIRIDPQTNQIAARVVLTRAGPGGPQGVAAGLGSVWVGVPNINSVVRVNPATNSVAAVIRMPSQMSPCGGIAVGSTAVWVTNCLDGTFVARIDPATNKVVSILDVGGLVVQPAAEGDTVWFVSGGDPDAAPAPGYLIGLRADDSVATKIALPTGFVSGGTAAAFGAIWISDFAHPRLIRIPEPT